MTPAQKAAYHLGKKPAHPIVVTDNIESPATPGSIIEHAGLTKREYMATAILAGLYSDRDNVEEILSSKYVTNPDQAEAALAHIAVTAADALLVELAEKPS